MKREQEEPGEEVTWSAQPSEGGDTDEEVESHEASGPDRRRQRRSDPAGDASAGDEEQ